LLKDLRDAVWQLKKDEGELRQRMQQEELKNADLRQVINEVEKERDELNEELQKMKFAMIQIPSDKKEISKWSIVRWFLVVVILALFMSKFKKQD
jgi:peptidoglycan hydrolase CwlO-like protein